MKNEIKINRLLKYEVTFRKYDPYGEALAEDDVDSFTADNYTVDPQINTIKFFRTGNLIREYFNRPSKIVATPVDDEDLA